MSARRQTLSPATLLGFLAIFFCLYLPLCYWLGLASPLLLDLRGVSYPAGWGPALAWATMLLLFLAPLGWITFSGTIDYLALHLVLNGLIVFGYFFIDQTATKIFGAEQAVLGGAAEALAINAIGFFFFIGVLGVCYIAFALRAKPLPPLSALPEILDRRLSGWLFPVMIVVILLIALPMALTRTIPMVSEDPMVGRFILEQSNLGRPLYNLASSLLPALAAGSLILALRREGWWARLCNWNSALALAALAVQYLTSNRLPLAYTLLVFFTLFTLERRFSKGLLSFGLVLFFVVYLGLSGLSSILRQNRELLGDGHLVRNSFSEAFLGDNLSDLRDGAWVLGNWDYVPLNGKTYLGALASVAPSAVFPQKKEWYLGLVALRIVNWPDDQHFGLRLSFFVESFLNFGLAGVIGLAIVLGAYFAYLLRFLHLAAREPTQCLARNLRLLLLFQLGLTFSNSSEGFVSYSILALLLIMGLCIDLPAAREARLPQGNPA